MSGLTSVKPVMLENVESWGASMHIIRDPPKSVMTRRIDRVGTNNDVLDQVDGGNTRANEAISYFPRGVNPSVSVSYSNHGNGQSNSEAGGSSQAFLPYRIMKDGAFRPPIIRQEQLLPLSRQARLTTSVNTNTSAVDYSKNRTESKAAEYYKEIEDKVHAPARATRVYQRDTGPARTDDSRHAIQYHLHTSANSGVRAMDLTTRQVQVPVKGAAGQMPTASAPIRPGGGMIRYSTEQPKTAEGSQYVHDIRTTNMMSNRGLNLPTSAVLDFDPLNSTKNTTQISYYAPMSHTKQSSFGNIEHDLSRNLPVYHATTNSGRNIHAHVVDSHVAELERNLPMASAHTNHGMHGETNVSSRSVNLRPTISAGAFEGVGNMPSSDRQDTGALKESRKAYNARMAMTQGYGRR